MEQHFGVDFTSAILQDDGGSCLHRDIKEQITVKDHEVLLSKHQGRADMSVVVEVERAIGYSRLWDLVLDNGARCIQGMKNLVRVITFPPHALNACPLCEREDISRDSLLCHVLDSHSNCHFRGTELLQEILSVTDADSVIFNHLCVLSRLF